MIYSDILRDYCKGCVKEEYPGVKAKIRPVQHCAVISAIA